MRVFIFHFESSLSRDRWEDIRPDWGDGVGKISDLCQRKLWQLFRAFLNETRNIKRIKLLFFTQTLKSEQEIFLLTFTGFPYQFGEDFIR